MEQNKKVSYYIKKKISEFSIELTAKDSYLLF